MRRSVDRQTGRQQWDVVCMWSTIVDAHAQCKVSFARRLLWWPSRTVGPAAGRTAIPAAASGVGGCPLLTDLPSAVTIGTVRMTSGAHLACTHLCCQSLPV